SGLRTRRHSVDERAGVDGAASSFDDNSSLVAVTRCACDFLISPRKFCLRRKYHHSAACIADEILYFPVLCGTYDNTTSVDSICNSSNKSLCALLLAISLGNVGKNRVENDCNVGARIRKSRLKKVCRRNFY